MRISPPSGVPQRRGLRRSRFPQPRFMAPNSKNGLATRIYRRWATVGETLNLEYLITGVVK